MFYSLFSFFIASNLFSFSPATRNIHPIYKVYEYTNLSFTHAESPVWDEESNTLYWVDVLNQDVHALHYHTMEHRVKHIGHEEINIVMPIAKSNKLLVGVKSRLCILDWKQPAGSTLFCPVIFDLYYPDNVLNEGKADAKGRFWGGTKGRHEGSNVLPDRGAFYSVEAPDFVPLVHLKPVSISNGLAWALNNSVLYYIDSATRKIEAFDFDLQRGLLSKRRAIVDISDYFDHSVIPDGMTIDKDGFLWVALMFGGCIVRIDPDVRVIVDTYQLPVSFPSSIAWAGPDFEYLVVTTSRRNINDTQLELEPLAGSLFFLYSLETKGVKTYKFAFPGLNSKYYNNTDI